MATVPQRLNIQESGPNDKCRLTRLSPGYNEAHRVTKNTSVAGQLQAVNAVTAASEAMKTEDLYGKAMTDLYTRMVGAQQ